MAEELHIPTGLTDASRAWGTWFVPFSGLDIADAQALRAIQDALAEALGRAEPGPVRGPSLHKVHIGEPRCTTRMRPELTRGASAFLRERGAEPIAAGDTTVAYTGPRGHRENAAPDAPAYRELARRHGWAEDGAAGVPFVVLDRPRTSLAGGFEFQVPEQRMEIEGVRRFSDFFVAGGFLAAGYVVNHAHLTLHGLAGVAGCVKSVAMGLAALNGKLRMHQSLLPTFDPEKCEACGLCVRNCPEDALSLPDGAGVPVLDPDRCIGCGECEAVCTRGAVHLQAERIEDWVRGQETLPVRITDYTLGLMQGSWERMVHVLHLVRITERCDCINRTQTPMVATDLGLLVGKNPFAIDRRAGAMLRDALRAEGKDATDPLLDTAHEAAEYAHETYGILPETPFDEVRPQ